MSIKNMSRGAFASLFLSKNMNKIIYLVILCLILLSCTTKAHINSSIEIINYKSNSIDIINNKEHFIRLAEDNYLIEILKPYIVSNKYTGKRIQVTYRKNKPVKISSLYKDRYISINNEGVNLKYTSIKISYEKQKATLSYYYFDNKTSFASPFKILLSPSHKIQYVNYILNKSGKTKHIELGSIGAISINIRRSTYNLSIYGKEVVGVPYYMLFKWDNKGKFTKFSYVDKNGINVFNPFKNISYKEKVYNLTNQLIREEYFDQNRKLTFPTSNNFKFFTNIISKSLLKICSISYLYKNNIIIGAELYYWDNISSSKLKGYIYKDGKSSIIYDTNMGIILEKISQHRTTTYKYYASNKLEREEVHNYDNVGNVIRTDFNSSNENSFVLYSYNNKGLLITIKDSKNENRVISYDYDSYGNLIEIKYLDSNNELVDFDGYAIEKYKYDIKGNIIENSYYNKERKPISGFLGYYKKVVSNTGNGNIREEYWLNDKSEPMLYKYNGLNCYMVKKVKTKNTFDTIYYNIDMKSPLKTEHSKIYRIEDNIYIDSIETLNNKNSFKEITYTRSIMNSLAAIIEESNIDENNKYKMNKASSYAFYRIKYNNENRIRSISYYDEYEKLIPIYNSVVEERFKYNQIGIQTEIQRYNLNGDLVTIN